VPEPGAGEFDDVQLLVVGMNPSFREVEEGEPMVGPTFHEMRRGLGPLLDTTRIRKTNIFNCRTQKPGKTVEHVNRDPTAKEIKACAARWLVPELRAAAEAEDRGANITLWTLGKLAFDTVFQGKFGAFSGHKNSRGQRINRDKLSFRVLADRIEKWAHTAVKVRRCMSCGAELTEPRVRKCAACKLKAKEKKNE
jgi:uracil-DNA glycosylase